MSGSNIVAEWLRSLHLGQYADGFLDNGYDDLEICKQVGDPDLDAIGVFNPIHRLRLLQSVKTLREEGAASVYFSLEDADECLCDAASARSSRTSSGRCSEKERLSPTASSSEGSHEPRYRDEYEEGKAELVKIPRIQLKMLLRERLTQDGIRLSCQPYSTSDGERGYLEGLASRYADTFNTHYGDVLEHLEELRRREWDEMSPRMRVLGGGGAVTPDTPPGGPGPGIISMAPGHAGGSVVHGLTTSHSQPIYVPGKYSPSSCLSDKEEDEIYGFGYGVFGKQILARQQQKMLLQGGASSVPASQPPVVIQQPNYQSCLSPRSAYFYEFPPNDQHNQNTSKKRTTFARFLRGLKTSHRKEKHGASASSPRHGRAARGIPQRVDTPDSVLQSGLGFGPDLGQHTVLRSMVDPRDYDRLRHLQMNGGAPNSFEETIYRLKLQDALKKKEKFHREHEEILRDIRQGLLQLGKEGIRGPLSGDDTYMYDEDARALGPGAGDRGHWYDEPPYESDPEDFLMGGGGAPGAPTATIRNGRVCFTLNLRQEPRSEGVISLRSAGDISLPRGEGCGSGGGGTPRRGLILPQAGYPPTIIPLTHSRSARDRESGDYAGSDVQSISSRLSTLSVETSRSEQHEGSVHYMVHPSGGGKKQYRAKSYFKGPGCEEGLSPSQSSDYEDQEELENCSQQIATVHVSNDGRSAGVAGLVGKVRGLRQDVQRKISKLRNENDQRRSDQAFPCSASSVESLPSGSGSSTQALVRADSNHSSISAEDRDPSPTNQIIGRARALVDYIPSPYDKEALKFKKGDVIDIISMNASGLWKGICQNRIGTFKFINVELLSERAVRVRHDHKWQRNMKGKPTSVEELLQKINMQEHISVFVLNGYEDLGLFKEIEPADLDYLGIVNSEHRAKILTAVQLLHDLESGSEGDIAGSSSEGDDPNRGLMLTASGTCSPFGRRQFPRDSGCYDASLKSTRIAHHASPQEESDASDQVAYCDNTNNLDSVVQQCTNEILARVKQSQNLAKTYMKDECGPGYMPNIPVMQPNVANSPSVEKIPRTKETYVGAHGQTMLIDPMKRNAMSRGSNRKISGASSSVTSEDTCEADQKLTVVKYVVGGSTDLGLGCESGNIASLSRGGCLSEKSSDSGVSSSSLSSANNRDGRQLNRNIDSPTRGINIMNCANRSSPTITKNNALIQGPDNAFQ